MMRCSWTRWLACVLISVSLPAAGTTLPVELFANGEHFSAFKISPDGEFVAAIVAKEQRAGLVFWSFKDGKLADGEHVERFSSVFRFEWAAPRKLIYVLERPGSDTIRPYHSNGVYMRDLDRRDFTPGASGIRTHSIEVLPNQSDPDALLVTLRALHGRHASGAPYALAPSDPRPVLASIELRTGFTRLSELVPLAAARLLLDASGQLRFAVGYQGEDRKNKELTAIWRPRVDAQWQFLQVPGFRSMSVHPQAFTTDDAAVQFTGVRSDESLSALYRLELRSGEVRKLYQHPVADIAETVKDLRTGEIAGVAVDAARREYHWLDANSDSARLYATLERAYPEHTVRITSTTRDLRKSLLFVNSDRNPGEYYLFDHELKTATQVIALRSGIDVALMRSKEPVRIVARDAAMLHGYVTRPAGTGPHPLVVMPHDGVPGARDSWDFDPVVQLLASRGYAVLQVNFRGSGGYGLDFEIGGHRQWGARIQDDITDATRWAIAQGIAAAERVCIYGRGYGGYAALMGAAREPGLYRCAAAYSGVYDLEGLAKSREFVDFRLAGKSYTDTVFGTRLQMRRSSPIRNIDALETPVLLMHGVDDARIPFDQGRRMRSELRWAGKAVEWLELPASREPGDADRARADAYRKLLAFLGTHLPVSPQPAAAARADSSSLDGAAAESHP